MEGEDGLRREGEREGERGRWERERKERRDGEERG